MGAEDQAAPLAAAVIEGAELTLEAEPLPGDGGALQLLRQEEGQEVRLAGEPGDRQQAAVEGLAVIFVGIGGRGLDQTLQLRFVAVDVIHGATPRLQDGRAYERPVRDRTDLFRRRRERRDQWPIFWIISAGGGT